MQITNNTEFFQGGWNALRVRYQHEKFVAGLLEAKGLQTFLPTYDSERQWKDRKKRLSLPLFAGYLFVEDVADRKLQVINTPGVCSILCASGSPAVIPFSEISALRQAIDSKTLVGPHDFLNEGDVVRVVTGPLVDVQGILLRQKDKWRLVISVQMLGRSAAVEIDASIVERVRQGSRRGSDAYGYREARATH